MTDKMAHLSRLLVARADAKDSGNYTCVPSGAHPASVIVHVLNGESRVTFTSTPLGCFFFFLDVKQLTMERRGCVSSISTGRSDHRRSLNISVNSAVASKSRPPRRIFD
jgi:hypothetical protein